MSTTEAACQHDMFSDVSTADLARFLKIEVPMPADDGQSLPGYQNGVWHAVIDMQTGIYQNWPRGKNLDILVKAVDTGLYFLLNDSKEPIRKYAGLYVPAVLDTEDRFRDSDYIQFGVSPEGEVKAWKPGYVQLKDWPFI